MRKVILFTAFAAIAALTACSSNSRSNSRSNNQSDNEPTAHEFYVDGVVIDFQMSKEELRAANREATIIQHIVPSVRSEVGEIEGYDYFVINDDVAVTFEDEKIDRFITWGTAYESPEGLRVGSSFGDVERVFPNMEFCMTAYSYNYRSQRYEMAVVLDNPSTCTSYIFFASAFSSVQWEALTSVAGGTDGWSYFYTSELSYTMVQSIWSSVMVSQIVVYDCSREDPPEDDYDEPYDSEYMQYGCLKYRLIHNYYSDDEMLELYNTSDETILVTGSLLNAIAPRGGDNTIEFEETLSPYETKYVDGFMENECTIYSVEQSSGPSDRSSAAYGDYDEDGYMYQFPCDWNLFNNGEIYELTLPNGDVIRYTYRCDDRWHDFHSSQRGIHYSGNLHYIQFALATSGWQTISSYRVKARRYDDSQWWPAVDPEDMYRTCDIVCEWYDFRTDVPLVVSFKKKTANSNR